MQPAELRLGALGGVFQQPVQVAEAVPDVVGMTRNAAQLGLPVDDHDARAAESACGDGGGKTRGTAADDKEVRVRHHGKRWSRRAPTPTP